MFTGDLRPNPAESVIAPSGEFPVELLIEGTVEAEYFHHVRSQLGVEVYRGELFHEVIDYRLHSPRIFLEKDVLRSNRENLRQPQWYISSPPERTSRLR